MWYTRCMESPREIHSDRPRRTLVSLLNPAIAGVMLIIGVLAGDPITFLLGIGMSLFVWFTWHARYEIFHDRLVIYYGRPRQKIVPLSEIEEVQLVLGDRALYVRNRGSRGMLLRPSDPQLFVDRLDDARRRVAG